MQLKIQHALIFAFLVVFMACKNNPSNQKDTPSVSDTSTDKKNNNYRHFRGSIGNTNGNDSITMDLVETKTAHNIGELPQFKGYFSYDKDQIPLSISGIMDSTGVLHLERQGRSTMDEFEGKFNADGTFTGDWKDFSQKKRAPFFLRETTNDGAIALDVFPFEDSIKLFDKVPNSPQATFELAALLPAKNTEGSVFEFLRSQILKELKGDSVVGNYDYLQIADLQKSARDSFFKTYRKELEDEKTDIATNQQLNFTTSRAMEVVSNRDNLLTLGFITYQFSGGAHGNYGTQLRTFDLETKKRVTLKDVFKPNYEATLNAALTKKAKWFFGIKPNESLEDNGYHSKIEANDNFAITKKGVLFNFVPYEIASYAEGEIQLYLSFEELKSIVK